jgi:hypothetical protein
MGKFSRHCEDIMCIQLGSQIWPQDLYEYTNLLQLNVIMFFVTSKYATFWYSPLADLNEAGVSAKVN